MHSLKVCINLRSSWDKGYFLVCVIIDRGFGEVWSARNQNTYIMYAIKKVYIMNDSIQLENEIATLKSCNFPFIVSYYGTEKSDRELWVRLVALRHE